MTRNDVGCAVRLVVSQVVSLVRPKRVILFGSAAEGRVGPDSDLDFLVVVPNGQSVRHATDRLNVGVRDRPMPCDFLVVTPAILRKHHHTTGMIYSEILERGQEVYAG